MFARFSSQDLFFLKYFPRGLYQTIQDKTGINDIFYVQVLISKRMIQDHMPDNVLDALEKVFKIFETLFMRITFFWLF